MTRRWVIVVVVVALGLVAGACGNGEVGGGGTATGDLPLLPGSSLAGGASRASGASGGSRAEMMAGDAATMTAEAPADVDTGAMYQATEYRLGAGIDRIGGKAAAYRLEADVDEDAVAKLARALDVDGDVREQGDSWLVGADGDGGTGGVGLQLFVGRDGTWSVNRLEASTRASSSVSASCSPDGVCTEDRVESPAPAPPANLPSDDEAEAKARDLFESAGVDVDGIEFRVDRHDFGVMATAIHRLDGIELAGLGMSASFGDRGVLQYASGSLATPSHVGDYPLVDTTAAFDRGYTGGGGVGIAVDSGAGVASVGSAEPAIGEDAPQPEPAIEPAPGPDRAPPSTLPPKIVELTVVRQVLIAEYGMCPGDPIYLVPAYVFGTADNPDEFGPVPAVEDDYLASSAAAGADRAVSNDDGDAAIEPCPGAGGGESVPGREPEGSPPPTG